MTSARSNEQQESPLRLGGSRPLSLAAGIFDRHVITMEVPADANRPGRNAALERFVRLAGGRWGRIVIIPAAAEESVAYGRSYAQSLSLNGAGVVTVLHLTDRRHADDLNAMALIQSATGILLAASDSAQLSALLEGTAVLEQIRLRNQQGMVIAVTSAASGMFAIPLGPPLAMFGRDQAIGA